jgi:XrtN system VIT domain protein
MRRPLRALYLIFNFEFKSTFMIATTQMIRHQDAGEVSPLTEPKPTYPGYILLTISFAIFILCDQLGIKERDPQLTIFFFHYFLGIVYVIALLYHRSFGLAKSWKKENIHHTIIALNLFLISAFALNRSVAVFGISTTGLSIYLVLSSLTLLSFRYLEKLPAWVNGMQLFFLGAGIALYGYLTIAAGSFYFPGSLGFVAFGIGGHIFVPVALLASAILLCIYSRLRISSLLWCLGGTLSMLIIAANFTIAWKQRISDIETTMDQSILYPEASLPGWVKVAQSIPDDWLTRKILQSDQYHVIGQHRSDDWDFVISNRGDVRKHDPLVLIASAVKELSLPGEDRVKILQALGASRHGSEERLWSGDMLSTASIVSDVLIFPRLHLAYSEKYFTVRNGAEKGGWRGNSQEAIYTFQLPEGSVVSSLSLWIGGKEEKAILTSKQKATEAYKTVVGVEARDPSVVHWQEGNLVTVRVFPCTTEEERKFKIGITTPLAEKNGFLIYKNIAFLGPDPTDAAETVRLRFAGDKQVMTLPGFDLNDKGDLVRQGKYQPDLTVSIKAQPIASNNFSHGGFNYEIASYKAVYEKVQIKKIYLDLNSAWEDTELTEAQGLMDSHEVYVFSDQGFVRLSSENFTSLSNELRSKNFSLFPYHLLPDTKGSVVVTKGNFSVHLADLRDSPFATSVAGFFSTGKKVKVYNLDGGASTYTATLRELRAFEFAQGSLSALKQLLTQKKFPSTIESEDRVLLHDARLVISRSKTTEPQENNAPDHLARLFGYNDIVRKIGSKYFTGDFVTDELVKEASGAYVVSPVSSLIVLESKKDYERFDIHGNANSLLNASMDSTGAVPEPHEWALIVLAGCFVLFTLRKDILKLALWFPALRS